MSAPYSCGHQKEPRHLPQWLISYETAESTFERKATATVNPLARNQNPTPSGTETEGESPANPATKPVIESVKKPRENAPETKTDPGAKPEEHAAEPDEPPAVRPAPQSTLPEVAPGLKIPPILLEGDESAPRPTTESAPKFALVLTTVTPASEPDILPEAYGTGRLWLAARDPHCLYVRWDLTSEQQKHYNTLAARGHLVIRVHLETLQDLRIAEVELHSDSRHCFIHVPFAGRRYLAELGYYQAEQRWNSIAVSESASTPPEGIAQHKTARFATVPTRNLLSQPTASGAVAPRPTETPERAPTHLQTETAGAESVSQSGSLQHTSIQVPELKPYAENLLRPWSENDTSPQIAHPESFEAEAAPVSDWTPAQEEALARIIDSNMGQLEPPSSAEMIELLQVPAPLGPPISISSLPPQEQISSWAGGQAPLREDFWFSVNAELVIYGATDPNAHVTIAGRPIQLRPDGTFSYRFALPDGRYELPIVAVSPRGDLRRADLEFYRGTNYEGEVQAHPQEPDLRNPDAGNVS
jgi:uncharacterized protein